MRRVASRLALMVRLWTASPAPTGSRKRVSPLATNGTLVCDPPTPTLTVLVMAVTAASINAVSVTLACPATV